MLTLDEMIEETKKVGENGCYYEFALDDKETEQLLYWLTEYRAMISGRESGSLSECLAEHLVWAESNSYECPITLAEDLEEAISTITDLEV